VERRAELARGRRSGDALPVVVLATLIAGATAPGWAQEPAATFEAAGYHFEVRGELGLFELALDTTAVEPGVTVVTLQLAAPEPAVPGALTLRWSLPSHDIQGFWTSRALYWKSINADWYPSRVSAMLARDAPVVTLFGTDDGNRLTFALSDALNASQLTAGVREEDGRIYPQAQLLIERHRAVTQYRIELWLDRRPVRYERALADVADWWAGHEGYEPSPVPETARLPMYSTWYSYHQNVTAEALLPEIELARPLGYEAIIIDDGWQTLDSNRGYPYTGDWEPEKIPDMRGFVDAAHSRDMKVLLWYAISLVGERSALYPRFEGKYLRYWDGQGAWELDPRYPEVREHIIDTYATAMREWGVDGFKLDFIGRFVANDATVLEAVDGRDYGSVNEATDRLFTDLMQALRAIDPDVMIEFRQPYIGPLMRKYGNMFRAGDSPNAITTNRVRVVDLRLLSGSTAVHSDMIMWHRDEPVTVAARQLLNVLFSVPQVSVRLAELPADHRAMLRHYTDYWRQNRHILLDGDLRAHQPLLNYPVIRAHARGEEIVVRYADQVIDLATDARSRLDIVNAGPSGQVAIRAPRDLGSYDVTILDVEGGVVRRDVLDLTAGLHHLEIPVSGMVSLRQPGDR
jgi:alpha-galactosidase